MKEVGIRGRANGYNKKGTTLHYAISIEHMYREVFEEVGLKLGHLRYFGSQSWPFPNSLMLGFHAEYESGDIVCQEGEIADAQWFRADNLPQIPPKTAISGWLIQEFIDQLG